MNEEIINKRVKMEAIRMLRGMLNGIENDFLEKSDIQKLAEKKKHKIYEGLIGINALALRYGVDVSLIRAIVEKKNICITRIKRHAYIPIENVATIKSYIDLLED